MNLERSSLRLNHRQAAGPKVEWIKKSPESFLPCESGNRDLGLV